MAWTVGRRIGVRFPSMPPLFCFNFLLKLFCNYSTYSVEFLILFTGICSFVATAKVEFNIFRVFWSLYLRELHGRIPATIVRMDSQRYPRMLLHGHIHGNRPSGRPKKRWLDNVTENCEALRLPLPDADSLAHDRVRWRTLIYSRECGAARAHSFVNVAKALSH